MIKNKNMKILLFSTIFLISQTYGIDNGLARLPPMGWMSWAQFYCEVDCVHHPHSCISESLYIEMADKLVSEGYSSLGYDIIHIDDCWMSSKRNSHGQLTANATRFPSGIRRLADHIHSRGLRLGIYEDLGSGTCAGYPGTDIEHIYTDAKTFAMMHADYLKLDGCNSDKAQWDEGYPMMTKALKETGRDIVYACSWPLFETLHNITPNYAGAKENCNVWRIYNDVEPSWKSITEIINFVDKNQDELSKVNGPCGWNDMDMIIVGNTLANLTVDQARVQMTLWSIWSAPLIMSNDLRIMPPAFKGVLQNRDVISIDQDPLGIMGKLVVNTTNVGVYVKPMLPKIEGKLSYAIAVFNRHLSKTARVTLRLASLGLNSPTGYIVDNVWEARRLGVVPKDKKYTITVRPTSTTLWKCVPVLSFELHSDQSH